MDEISTATSTAVMPERALIRLQNSVPELDKITSWIYLSAYTRLDCGTVENIIEGKLRTRNYTDKETQKTVYVTEVLAENIEFADSKPQGPFGETNGQPVYDNTDQFNTDYGRGNGEKSGGNPNNGGNYGGNNGYGYGGYNR